jgi:hypothetical protein
MISIGQSVDQVVQQVNNNLHDKNGLKFKIFFIYLRVYYRDFLLFWIEFL